MNFLYRIPAALLLLLAVITAIAGAAAGQTFVHRRFNGRHFVAHNEVGGVAIAVSGAIYAALLGFLTVVAWQHYQEAEEIVVLEADADIGAWHTAVGLPPATRQRIRADVLNYATIMVYHEWPAMKDGEFDLTAPLISMDAMDATGTALPGNASESNAQNSTMQELIILHDARQRRVAINGSGISSFQWLVLLEGAACITGFCWLLGMRNPRMHLLMTSAIVTVVVSILVLLFELQYPFRSSIGITPEAWRNAIEHIHEMQTGSLPGMAH